jgi:hypothetical protein
METVHIEETATIWRFVVMFASGDGLAVLFAASNPTDWGLRDGRNRADRSVQDRPPGALAAASLPYRGRANLSISVVRVVSDEYRTVPQPILVALDPAVRAIIETGYNRTTDPSQRVQFALLPPPSAWATDAQNVAAGFAQTAQESRAPYWRACRALGCRW